MYLLLLDGNNCFIEHSHVTQSTNMLIIALASEMNIRIFVYTYMFCTHFSEVGELLESAMTEI